MFQAYKTTPIKSFLWISLFCAGLFFVSCSSNPILREEKRLTEREVTFQKGLALFNANKYAEAEPFFLKVSQSSTAIYDEVYNSSLWNLSLIYEKFSEFEKSILILQELEARPSTAISIFKIQLGLMKNYIRVGNQRIALEIRRKIDRTSPKDRYGITEIYFSLEENVNFNFDMNVLEELRFLGDIQKYFIFVMESSEPSLNVKATDMLIYLYDRFFTVLEKSSLQPEFRRTLCIELLEQLRVFDSFKLDDPRTSSQTIPRFTEYSNQKQKYLTDWLHR